MRSGIPWSFAGIPMPGTRGRIVKDSIRDYFLHGEPPTPSITFPA